jgi:hypothetical protein
MFKIFFLAILLCTSVMASPLRYAEGDAIISADHTKTWTMPATTGTLALSQGTSVQEVPSGTINGSNVTFTLTYTPTSTASVQLYQDGLLLFYGSGNDYTISSTTITMKIAPAYGQTLLVVYLK